VGQTRRADEGAVTTLVHHHSRSLAALLARLLASSAVARPPARPLSFLRNAFFSPERAGGRRTVGTSAGRRSRLFI